LFELIYILRYKELLQPFDERTKERNTYTLKKKNKKLLVGMTSH